MTTRERRQAVALFRRLLTESSWRAWHVCVTAAFGLPLTGADLALYRQCTGRQRVPGQRVDELWCICGRRSGKTRAASALAVWAATIPTYRLAPGEVGVVLLLGGDRDQAHVAKNYIAGYLRGVPALAALIDVETQDEIRLNNRITIEVGTSSQRVRGRTVVCAILDEVATWPQDVAAVPDVEVLAAVRPALATTRGLLIALSSPYRQRGIMFDAFRTLYANDAEAHALCWRAPTRVMNGLIPELLIEQRRQQDPSRAASEWDAEWRADLEDAFAVDALAAVTVRDRRELPFVAGTPYVAFADPSGGLHDSFALAVAHRDASDMAILDLVHEWHAPCSPAVCVREAAAILRRYQLDSVRGDRYAGQWTIDEFARTKIRYVVADHPTGDYFNELVSLVNSQRCELLDVPRLRQQLAGLERRIGRTKESIGHRPGGFDDLAAAAAGALVESVTAGTALVPVPREFTSCSNYYATAATRCAILGRGPWLPSDPLCRRECPAHAPIKRAYDQQRAILAAANERIPDHLTFIRDHVEFNDVMERFWMDRIRARLGL